jgi:hypothetical protein
MAYWNHETSEIVTLPPEPYDGFPGWQQVDCGCCAGLEWGGDYPVECPRCKGAGFFALHVASGRLADYPGGPFRGRQAASIEKGAK